MSSSKIVSLEQKRIFSELKIQEEKIEFLFCKLSALYINFRKQFSNYSQFEAKKYQIEASVAYSERTRDNKRSQKLNNLISRTKDNFQINYADVINLTQHTIHVEIKKLHPLWT